MLIYVFVETYCLIVKLHTIKSIVIKTKTQYRLLHRYCDRFYAPRDCCWITIIIIGVQCGLIYNLRRRYG